MNNTTTPPYSWVQCKKQGDAAEDRAYDFLRSRYPDCQVTKIITTAARARAGKHDEDIRVTFPDGHLLRIDVKSDTFSRKTGNICLEEKSLCESIDMGVNCYMYIHAEKAGSNVEIYRFIHVKPSLLETLDELVADGTIIHKAHLGNKNAKQTNNPAWLIPIKYLNIKDCPISNKVVARYVPSGEQWLEH